ncbi:hypothetical protein L1049_015662 [Liquidambar formosana]|uniref:Uncharacterized protein n=1 Tax=Liquidambar formosana TaxID=63359 RepID=A0AAP0RZ95_LIQFO
MNEKNIHKSSMAIEKDHFLKDFDTGSNKIIYHTHGLSLKFEAFTPTAASPAIRVVARRSPHSSIRRYPPPPSSVVNRSYSSVAQRQSWDN